MPEKIFKGSFFLISIIIYCVNACSIAEKQKAANRKMRKEVFYEKMENGTLRDTCSIRNDCVRDKNGRTADTATNRRRRDGKERIRSVCDEGGGIP